MNKAIIKKSRKRMYVTHNRGDLFHNSIKEAVKQKPQAKHIHADAVGYVAVLISDVIPNSKQLW